MENLKNIINLRKPGDTRAEIISCIVGLLIGAAIIGATALVVKACNPSDCKCIDCRGSDNERN